MKTFVGISCIVVSIFSTLLAQMTLNGVQNHLPKNRSGVDLQMVTPTLLQIKRTGNDVPILKSISKQTQGSTADLVIDLSALDTTQYSSRFRYWRELPVASGFHGLTIADINRNERKEIYSFEVNGNTTTYAGSIFEYKNDSSFIQIHQFPDSIGIGLASADVDNDGLSEVLFQEHDYPRKSHLLTQNDSLSLPTAYRSIFDTVASSGQPRYVNFYDINSDSVEEMIYYLDGVGDIFPPSNQIAVYNTTREKFDIVYYNRPNTTYSAGFTFGDFDIDGKQNIANGGIDGELFIYEHVGGNNYTVKLADTVPTKNAYYSCMTNDLDGNGKPELWMGGDFFSNDSAITRLVVYESTGDDTYARKYQIDIVGVFSFFAGNMVSADMNHDGKQEVVLCIDQNLLIFKNTSGNNYALWYIKKNDLALAGMNSVWYEVTVTDFDGDKYPEIIVGSDIVVNNKIRFFSNVYRKNVLTSVRSQKETVPEGFQLFQNYPNPFNGETIIRYILPARSDVHISIYNILGKEIAQQTFHDQSAGMHEFRWNTSNTSTVEVSSGVYFIHVQAGVFSKTIKTQLLR